MTMIRPETEMKDSGIAWIGDIPSNWETIPLKKIVVDRAGGAWGNEPYENNSTICMRIADFDFDRGVFQDKSETELTKRSYKEYQIDKLLLQTNDICIEKSGGGEKTPVGRAVLFDKPYDALFANFMDRIRVDNAVSFPKYVEYYLRAMYFLSVTTLYIKQTTGIQNLNVTSLLEKEVITLPSLSEQQAIADYLDETCSKIDEIIAEAKASIDEYKELKQSVIFEAVTKGLDKNVEMKGSGSYWIGDIPLTWSTIKTKYVIKIENGSDPSTEGDTPVYGSGANSFKTCGEYKVGPTVLLGRKGATLHIPHYIEGKYWNVDTAFNTTSIEKRINLKYFYYVAFCFDYTRYISQTTLPGMTQTSYRNIYIPYPPMNVQNRIVLWLDNKIDELDSLIAEKESLIADLEAYKKSLIYEVVTGKRRVV